MQLTPDDVKAIDAAVAAVRDRLKAEDAFDLRQELALKLLRQKRHPDDVRAWAFTCACHWVSNLLRDEAAHLAILEELRATQSMRPRYQVGEDWEPNWYPPHKDATEFAPFACVGARRMMTKPAMHTESDVEKALAEFLDFKGVWSRGRRKL